MVPIVVTSVYVLASVAVLGTQPWQKFGGQQEDGLVAIFDHVTHGKWVTITMAAGVVISIFTVMLVTTYGQTRILLAVDREGFFADVACDG